MTVPKGAGLSPIVEAAPQLLREAGMAARPGGGDLWRIRYRSFESRKGGVSSTRSQLGPVRAALRSPPLNS